MMRKPVLLFLMALISCMCALAEAPRQGKNRVIVRGQQQDVYFFSAGGPGPHRKILFAPGDGGWRGFAITIAQNLQSAGYDVYGMDTRRYLQSFTGSTVLKPGEIASDLRQIVDWMRQGSSERVLLVGWSEGAGLGLAAAADDQSKNTFSGLVAFGVTEQNVLAWRWADVIAEIAKKMPNEPTFASADFLGKISPLPLYVIASTQDEFVTQEASRKLFSLARDPKRFTMIEAKDHKYTGNTDTFFRTLKDALSWISQQQK